MVRKTAKILCGVLCATLLTACSGGHATSSQPPAASPSATASQNQATPLEGLTALLPQDTARPLSEEFFTWGDAHIDPAFTSRVKNQIDQLGYYDHLFYDLFGATLYTLYDRFTGAIEADPTIHEKPLSSGPPVLAFTGDVNLADTWENMLVYKAAPGGLPDVITEPLLSRMRSADVLLINNEFTFSDRGAPMEGKLYTFRAATENVALLQGMGADLVSLANNHVYDYGQDAFLDTLSTLTGAGIPYIGAGQDLAEAMLPQYFIVNGIKVAYVAASRAEKYILTPGATQDQPGVLRCYEEADLLAAVATARENADVVVVYPHWGTENTWVLEEVQVSLAHTLVEAGADLIVGAHPHQLQGIEFYEGVPIVYSLGNFWFNTDRVDTALLEVELHGPGDLRLRIQPCLQSGGVTSLLETPEDRARIFTALENYSEGRVQIDENGWVRPA